MCNKGGDPDVRGDLLNITLLIFMYVLQCIPRGLSAAIPFILQQRKSSYVDQAKFSFVTYSYCLKLLWAPLVDCVYSKRMGRRKTWLIPSQYMLGATLFLISMNIDAWLGNEDASQKPNIHLLAISFFACIFFSATQDIAVDGWSLTMLQKKNVGYAGTCNLIGYAIGQFLGYNLFLILDSKEFWNHFRSEPQDHGLIGFSDKARVLFADFIFAWSLIFFISTTLILVFKKDSDDEAIEDEYDECNLSLRKSYTYLWRILKMTPIQILSLVLLTSDIGFGPINGVVRLKLIDAGLPHDNAAVLTMPSLLFILMAPFVFSRYLTGSGSMRTFVVSYVLKLMLGIIYAMIVKLTFFMKASGSVDLPISYYWVLVFVYNLENLVDHTIFITIGAFFCRVSDPKFGGIYLTLFNTVSNIGCSWPKSVCLWLVDPLTLRMSSSSDAVVVDGFYTEIIVCLLIGCVWLRWGVKEIRKIDNEDTSLWITKPKRDRRKILI